MIRDIPIRWLLLLALLCAGMLPLMVVSLVSYGTGRSELKRQAGLQLESVRDSKRAQLLRFFEERRHDVDLLAQDPYIQTAFLDLRQAFLAEGGAAGRRLLGGDHRRFEAPDSYRAVHDKHFPFLSQFVDLRGYYDLLLLDADSGETCFSVEKERDFAAVIADQPTALREVWREVVRSRRTFLSDTRPYPPSANAAAQFVAAPIEQSGRLLGVVALQIGIAEVNAMVGERSGMGSTGETWILGPDFRIRSDSARDPRRTVQASFLDVGQAFFRNDASEAAIRGETGSGTIKMDGRRVLAAWAPFDGAGARWGVIAEIDEEEIDAQIGRALDRKILALLVVSAAGVVLLALLLSQALSRSIGSVGTQLVRLSDAVLQGELGTRAQETAVSVDFRGVVHRINDLVEAFVARLDSLPVAALLLDPDLRIRFANTAACRIAGGALDSLVGKRCCEAFRLGRSCQARCLVREALESRAVVSAEVDGPAEETRFLVTASPLLSPEGSVVGGFEILVDRSEALRAAREKRLLEDRVARMQRLEAVGTFAGGVAHDFNNILTCMLAYTDIAQGLLPEGSPAAPPVKQLETAIERAADLVGQILAFSRQLQVELRPLDLGPLVKEAAKLLAPSLPPSVELRVNVPERSFAVRANPTQMHQVVLNLLTNAHQALAGTGGTLTVTLSDQQFASGDPCPTEVDLPAGRYRVLEVRDSGCGMDARTLERVFEPFFTTKPVGQGTGMGLALVHGIVTSLGGAVLVQSAPGQGSAFRVLLPGYEGKVGENDDPGVPEEGRGKRVLFVDDERRVCETSRQLLEVLGYRVRTATSGSEAITELEEHAADYDVVITDLRMPDLSGLEVAAAARSRRTDLPVVLTTAYADGIGPEEVRAAGLAEVVLKPFRKSDLARVLQAVLNT